MVYELSGAGPKRLQEHHVVSPATSAARGRSGEVHFRHALLVSQMMASFEIGVAQVPGHALIREEDVLDRLANAAVHHLNPRAIPVGDKRYVIPDGLFGVRSSAGVVLYALEVDRGFEPIRRGGRGSSYREKFDLYRTLIGGGLHKRLLSTPAPLAVLHATTSEARVGSMMRAAGGAPYHLFRSLPDIAGAPTMRPIADIARTPWIAADGTPFVIAG